VKTIFTTGYGIDGGGEGEGYFYGGKEGGGIHISPSRMFYN